ncbi:MAG: biotin/lipoyl-containing protein, partial [Pseudomonadales bacterium]
IAPSPHLPKATRDALLKASVAMAKRATYRGLGTFEYLVDADNPKTYHFIEANARLQVEHTVTEAITGLDLVQIQLGIAQGRSLDELGLKQAPPYKGFAIQSRINMETPGKHGQFQPTGGVISLFEPPSGPGIRTDSFASAGYRTSSRYDSLLAKLVVHSRSDDFSLAAAKSARALENFRLEGFSVNIPFLTALAKSKIFTEGKIYTRYVDQHLADLTVAAEQPDADAAKAGLAGTQLASSDPLAVLDHGKGGAASQQQEEVITLSADIEGPAGSVPVPSPLQGTIVQLLITDGELVYQGQDLVVMDAMKMEHVIQAPVSGEVCMITAEPGDAIVATHPILFIEAKQVSAAERAKAAAQDLDHIRPDLAEAMTRQGYKLDENR